MTQIPTDDDQFEDSVIEEVTREGEYWALRADSGWSFSFEASHAPEFVPQVGHAMRQYGGLGRPVRGLVIDGQTIYYRSPAEETSRHRKWVADEKAKRLREFEESGRAKLDAQYDALPLIFQARIDKFRRNNPEFRVEYEGYEMFCCEEAVKLATALPSEDEVRAFAALDYAQQKLTVPTLAYDEHSGNTFGAAVMLARLYLAQPQSVEQMHGALAPLVGSKEYGCIPR